MAFRMLLNCSDWEWHLKMTQPTVTCVIGRPLVDFLIFTLLFFVSELLNIQTKPFKVKTVLSQLTTLWLASVAHNYKAMYCFHLGLGLLLKIRI